MARQRTQKAPRGGGTWLVLLIVIGGLLALFALAPDGVRSAIGIIDRDPRPGAPPVQTQQGDEALSRRHAEIEPRTLSIDPRLAVAETEKAKPTDAAISEEENTAAPPDDLERAREVLAEAEELYRSYQWDAATSVANKITVMDADEQTHVRAQRIILYAETLKDLFARLDQKGELERNIQTHPLLVTFTTAGDEMQAVPVEDFMTKEVPDTDDPVGYINAQLNSTGKVALLTRGGGFELKKGQISDLRQADVARIHSEARSEYETRMQRMRAIVTNRTSPMAWYEAGRFAYQHRLDDEVVPLLEKAVELDPFLADTIKNERAQEIYLTIVEQIEKKGNRAAATTWMMQLKKHYQDTPVYDQAQAYYNEDLDMLRSAREQAMAKARERQERARRERLERARKVNDTQAMAAIQEEEPQAPTTDYPDNEAVAAVDGDLAKANQLFNQGAEIYARANAMPICEERDNAYGEAIGYFTQARDIYYKLGMEAEGARANQLRYGCIKNRRF